MPAHDWARVLPGTFHDFHCAWIIEIRNALNGGLLPGDFYAQAEQVAGGPHPDVLTLEIADEPPREGARTGGTVLLETEAPPQVRYTMEAEAAIYATKANHIAIYHATGDRVVAFIEIVSRGNKRSASSLRQFIDKLRAALDQGLHLLVVDMHQPGKHDPQGLHAAFWLDETPTVTPEEPLSVAAYRANSIPRAYFEPVAIGARLPEFPLFLTPERYVNVPLEATYQAAWRGVPERWKRVIDGV